MPEGDTLHHAALRVHAALAGRLPDELLTPHPRFTHDHWPERLTGRRVTGAEARGKHLFLHFEGGLVIHSHLRMTGAWSVGPIGRRWRRSPSAAWLVIRAAPWEVVQFGGPVLELLTQARLRSDPRLTRLGPDLVAPAPFDERLFLRRLRADDPTRTIGDALLDQQTVAGIGNFWKSEGLWRARLDPWRTLHDVTDDQALALVRLLRPLMQEAARTGDQRAHRTVYGRAGAPCPRCGPPALIERRGQGDDHRTTYWCPRCQTGQGSRQNGGADEGRLRGRR
jgi:endonuclease-8